MKKSKIASAALSAMLVGGVVSPVFADQIIGDGDVLKSGNQNEIDVYVEEGQPWSQEINVAVFKDDNKNKHAAFPVLGTISADSTEVALSQKTFSVAGYNSNASVTIVGKAVVDRTYHVDFQANKDELDGFTSSGHDQVTIKIHVTPKVVVDTTAPVFDEIGDVTIEATGTTTPVKLEEPKTDDDTATITKDAPTDGFKYGDTTVTWTAKDPAGNTSTATQIVHVKDTTAPKLTIPSDVTKEATARQTGVEIGEATATDIFGVTIENNAPETFPFGPTVVKWTAKDEHGNETVAYQTVTITDTTAPELSVPTDITKEATAKLTPVKVGDATATDIFDFTLSKNPTDELFGLGETDITWTATDEHGNSSQAIQKVKIVDTTAPDFISLPKKNITVTYTGPKTQVNIGEANADDIFGATVTNNAPTDGFDLGTTIVTWTAKDPNGNVSTFKQEVNVVPYSFGGFLQPINTWTNIKDMSVFKQGSTIPVKFQLKNVDGQFITNAVANITVQRVDGLVPGEVTEAVSTSAATTGSLCRYEDKDNQYIYNLSTKSLAPNSQYKITVNLNDGKSYFVIVGLK